MWLDRLLRRLTRPVAGTASLTAGQPRKYDLPISEPNSVARVSGIARAGTANPGGALVRFDYFDADGQRIPGPYPGHKHSKKHGSHTLVPTARGSERFSIYLLVPASAVRVVLTFRAWRSEEVELGDLILSSFDPSTDAHSAPVSDDGLLRILYRRAVSSGEISTAAEIARKAFAASGSAPDQGSLDRIQGLLRELDPSWAPAIPKELRLSGPVRRNTVCHLFKVTYPHENSGGAIRGLNLVNSLRGVGYDSIVLTPLFYPKAPTATRRRSMDGTVYYNLALPGAGENAAPVDARLQYDALLTASIIAREAPAIIHAASGYRGYELALKALPIGARLGIPVIYEVRSFHEHLWGAEGTIDSEWTRLRMAQEERCMREAACVVTISQAMRNALIGRGVPEGKIHVVPNAVGDEFLEPGPATGPTLRRSLGIGEETVIGYVSNLSRREGHDILIRAVATLHAAGRDVRCLIVGDGSTRDDLKKLARKLGIADRTIFTGEVDHQTVRGYYEAIDIFVVPRRADYAADYVTPLKPFEALALGRPLIMSDRPVAAEIVGDQERGLLFKTGDQADLAATIARLIDDPHRRRALTEAGRKWIETERTWTRNAELYREIYDRLLADLRCKPDPVRSPGMMIAASTGKSVR